MIMKHIRFFSLLLMVLTAVTVTAQEVNKLYLGDVTGMKSRSVDVPVYVENTSVNISALQFDVVMPKGVTLKTGSYEAVLDQNRVADHQVRMSILTGKERTYRVMLLSAGNKTLRANKGRLFTVRMDISSSEEQLVEGNTYPLTVSNVVLSDSLGNNVVTEYRSGSLTIGASPDFVVSNVRLTSSATTVNPGDDVEVGWTVQNQGGANAQGGWNAHVFIVSTTTGEDVRLGIARHNDEALASDESKDFTAAFTVPRTPGLDGSFQVQVRLLPNSDSGEPTEYQQNNTTTGTDTYTLTKRLYLTLQSSMPERTGVSSAPYYCLLERSGSRVAAQTFSVSSPSTDNRATLESNQITIRQGSSADGVYVNIADDQVLNGDSVAYRVDVAGANGYQAVSATTYIIDDEQPTLSLELSKSLADEGDDLTMTVTTSRAETHDLKVKFSCDHPSRFTMPASVVIPAGQTSAEVTVKVIDDYEPSDTVAVTFLAAASNYHSGEALILLSDNDMPQITLTLDPSMVSEGAGPSAVMGSICRSVADAGSNVTVKISTTDEDLLYCPTPTIRLARGVLEATFALSTVDNDKVNGDHEVEVTAAVYVSSCGCMTNGKKGGVSRQTITVTDNDGPALKLTAKSPNMWEGSTGNVFEVERNDDPVNDLVVYITVSGSSDVTCPTEVTIPQGQTKATFTADLALNDQSDDSHAITFTARATGYASTSCWVMSTDQTLPDATVTDLTVTSGDVYATQPAILSMVLHNYGNANLPIGTPVMIMVNNKVVHTLYTEEALAPGQESQMMVEASVTLSDVAGTMEVKAVVNNDRSINELNYANNTAFLQLDIKPLLYASQLSTNKAVYTTNETITVTGKTTGKANREAPLEVYFLQGGNRYTVTVQTDADGDFTAQWLPAAGVSGRFVVGACMPGEELTTEMALIDIYGMYRATQTFLAYEMEETETLDAYIDVVNTGKLTVSGIVAEAVGKPDNVSISCEGITGIPAGETRRLIFHITGLTPSENTKDWQTFTLKLTSNEGAELLNTLHYVVYPATPLLKCSESSINTTMIKDTVRTYELTITNEGRRETGEIRLDLGNTTWLTAATPIRMASLAMGEEATVVLQMKPTADIELNSVKEGNIFISAANGGGVSIPMRVECVSEKTGKLIVDVWDEFTANTADGPHVSGATVAVLHPVTQKLLRQDVTPDSGKVVFENLPEGKYLLRVTHPKHESYSDYVVVSPGCTQTQRAFICYSAISVEMVYEPTEVEDEYNIVTTVKYETSVPAPVVKLDLPEKLLLEEIRTPYVFYATMTNVGLITAFDSRFYLAEQNGVFHFTPLVDGPWDILPQQSVVIPVMITKESDGISFVHYSRDARRQVPEQVIDCAMAALARYRGPCETWNVSEMPEYENKRMMQVREACAGVGNVADLVGKALTALGFSPRGETAFGGGSGVFNDVKGGNPGGLDCDPCLNNRAKPYINALLDMQDDDNKEKAKNALKLLLPCDPRGNLPSWARPLENDDDDDTYASRGQRRSEDIQRIASYGLDIDTIPFKYVMQLYYDAVKTLNGEEVDDPVTIPNLKPQTKYAVQIPDWQPSYLKAALRNTALIHDANYHELAYIYHVLGDFDHRPIPLERAHDLVEAVRQKWGTMGTEGQTLSLEEKNRLRTFALSDYEFDEVLQRLYNGMNRSGKKKSECVDFDALDACYARIQNDLFQINKKGYSTPAELVADATAEAIDNLKTGRNSTCATVKLKMDQKLTMTRQAVRGTLTVENGSQQTAMTDVKLNLVVTDPDGNMATDHIMEIHTEEISGFTGTLDYESGWTLAAGQTGVAKIIFIPTKYAAPTEPLQYTFAGTISFVDPFTGLPVTRELETERLTVTPSPNLELTYFMQRDIMGDDPLTENVEPVVPSQFSLLINNKGYGDATKVKMVTNQPRIISNDKGLLVDYEILSSQLNGGDKTLAMGASVATDFGTIPAQSQAYAQWWLTSTLTGHFTSYDVKATHVTSYDNPDLSLLDTVTIHELIHQIEIPGGENHTPKLIGFMANDEEDSKDLPDRLYLSDGTTKPIATATSVQVTKRSETEYLISVMSGAEGWNYGSVVDPTGGSRKLQSIERHSDSKMLPKVNFWQTDRTLRDAMDPLYENLLHFCDSMPLTGEQYVVTFEERPAEVLAVTSFSGLPAADTYTSDAVDTVMVTFNKPINTATFTYEDLTMLHEGRTLDLSEVEIKYVNDQTFKIGIKDLTTLDGYYSLTVQTKDIYDQLGFTGEQGKMQGWIQVTNGKVNLRVESSPEGAGTLTPSGTTQQDIRKYITVTATANDGYTFQRWMKDNRKVSDSLSYRHYLLGHTTLVAVFQPKTYQVIVNYDQYGGQIEGGGTGIYEYNQTVNLKAQPKSGYYFVGWKHGNETVSTDPELSFTVTGADTYSAEFELLDYVPVTLLDTNADNVTMFANPGTKNFHVTMNRKLSQNQWNTFCVPFDISEQQINKVWGYNTMLVQFKSVTDSVLNFEYAWNIKAGEPYLVKPERTVVQPELDYKGNLVLASNPQPKTVGDYSFVGIYSPRAWDNIGREYYYGVSSGKLVKAKSTSSRLNGMRAYFVLPANALNARLSIQGIETVGIDSEALIDGRAIGGPQRIYNLQGQRVNSDEHSLPAGIYIVNGKKQVIR